MLPPVIAVLLTCVTTLFRARATLYLENLALRHQLAVYQQSAHRPRLRPTDRLFWVCIPTVGRLARRPGVRPAAHGDRLAAAAIPGPLAAAEPGWEARPTRDC
jgi:hypothetical protein